MFMSGNVTVMVSDFERAMRFYTETLGMELEYRAGDDWAEVGMRGLRVGLHTAGEHDPRPGAAGGLSIGLEVESMTKAKAELEARGVTFEHEVDDGPVRLAFFRDPDNTPLYLCEVVSPT